MIINVLAFAPHPDDAEMGCGGLLLKLKSLGYKTGIIDLTQGELSSNGNLEIRKKETQDASDILKLDVRENLKLQDGNITNDPESRNKIIDVIRTYKPSIMLIPFHIDRHPDHENAYKLLKDSVFVSGLVKYERALKAYRPDIILNYMLHFEFKPSFITDITEVFDKKVEAVTAYKSQFFNLNKKDVITHISTKAFKDILYNRSNYFGLKINAVYGEPYFINSSIRINDPIKFFDYVRY
ncbi:MAG: bacillithiol biosynthesis deacetylase BshB1 [Actinomycetota bacterium]|nr:bacillithiol biosynthesis deacetylase BshB1 [Actinomycetota bacterium]